MITFQEATTMPANQVSTFVDAALRRVAIEYAYELNRNTPNSHTAFEALKAAKNYLNHKGSAAELSVYHNLTLSCAIDLGRERLQITGSSDNTEYTNVAAAAFACAPTGREAITQLLDAITLDDDDDVKEFAEQTFKTFFQEACAQL